MAQKVNPNAFRLGLTVPWSSRWFFKRPVRWFLEEDHIIRSIIRQRVLAAGIAGIDIERTGDVMRILIRASRPGLIIGRGGKGIDELRTDVLRAVTAFRAANRIQGRFSLNVNIEELRRSDVSAAVVAQQAAFDIERRKPYRGVLRRTLEAMMQNREVKGAKIRLSGRLNGAEISRREWLARGRMPLQTLRANIDYGEATAFNSYGTVGVKVWVYKGDLFPARGGQGAREERPR